jgi:hypothetical protein
VEAAGVQAMRCMGMARMAAASTLLRFCSARDAHQTLVALHLLRPPLVRSQWLCPDDLPSLKRAGGIVRKQASPRRLPYLASRHRPVITLPPGVAIESAGVCSARGTVVA